MVHKKAPVTASTYDQGYERELDYLYARRSAIDLLIQSLQEYDLSRLRWSDYEKNSKTA